MTNNGILLGSSVTQSAHGRETVRTKDDETSTITFYKIVQSDLATRQEREL
ncbi:MAG TPA: hypothetical protein VE445_00835 [Nitrososphaeraceae archaeon]|jgi:hypothetical protein|nr:hypothetical protein [Nitrososphaeraceae archaeon]